MGMIPAFFISEKIFAYMNLVWAHIMTITIAIHLVIIYIELTM
ncbi:hypothetical Protein YC6258_03498 [Gynuella sunshinyii YC6258]|uniref:Uncharacterized protein n=1 Tax=Gynuella sunshinyii YC6258 TaxID=1445510 RepID=A0A0C5VYP9_9GAMM|nr:hypothetical Protein YC6258_03498 [Gynuella sunshinyii YC6258]